MVFLTAGISSAQTTSTASEVKKFEVIAVDGNDLVVRLPEGTRQINVPPGFVFTVNEKPLSVSDLRPGMSGTATITTTTTVTPCHCNGRSRAALSHWCRARPCMFEPPRECACLLRANWTSAE
jgi:hypothetical protein